MLRQGVMVYISAAVMSVQRLRRWPNFTPSLAERLTSSGMVISLHTQMQ